MRVESEAVTPLESRSFTVYRGWSEELAEQLVDSSRESEMLRWVPRDATERFVHEDAAHEWYRSKQRIVYSLARKATLGGVIWFSRAPREEYGAEYTFAIRMYEEARGQKAAGPFVAVAHADFESCCGNAASVWLEAEADNRRALNLYDQHGYEVVDDKDGRIIMVKRFSTPVSGNPDPSSV